MRPDEYVQADKFGSAAVLSDYWSGIEDPPPIWNPDLEEPVPTGPLVMGALEPDVLYPSTHSSTVKYVQRRYQHVLFSGKHPIQLRWRDASADPAGPLAYVDFNVGIFLNYQWTSGVSYYPVDDKVTARLLYRVPVKSADGTVTADPATLTLDLGATWVVEDPGPAGMLVANFPINSQDDFNRLWLAMTEPAAQAVLELRSTATVYRETWSYEDEVYYAAATDKTSLSLLSAVAKPPPPIVVEPDPIVVDPPPIVVGDDPKYPKKKTRYVYPVTLECVQQLPFTFPLDQYAYMYEKVPAQFRPAPGGGLLLIDQFDPGEGRPLVTYYTDTGRPGQFYYKPQEFRIHRSTVQPYAPELRMIIQNAATSGSGSLDYRAQLVYRLSPYLDRFVLSALRQFLTRRHPDPKLTLLMPGKVGLRLSQPRLVNGVAELVEVTYDVDDLALEDGIDHHFELKPMELHKAVVLLTEPNLELSGELLVRLGGVTADAGIPVRMSFRRTGGRLVDTTYLGAVAADTVRVSVRNRLESPVVIDEVHPTPAASGSTTPVLARPLTPGPVTVAPGAAVNLDFKLEPPGSAITGLDPFLSLEVRPDLEKLLRGLMVNEGYVADTFAMTVTIDPGYFRGIPTGATSPITAVRVEFKPNIAVTLTAAAPRQSVRLPMPLLEWLLNRDAATVFRYRVVNLHGPATAYTDGAVGAEKVGTGPGELSVDPAGA